jgi:hypothetical protein
MLYHQSLTRAAQRLKLPVFQFERDTVIQGAAKACGITARELDRQLKALGKASGPPWRKEHVVACAGAMLALAGRPRR